MSQSLEVLAEQALSADGAAAATIDAFTPRPGQIALAKAIAAAVADETALLAEAGTGIGKTYAYLVPALLSGSKTVVSTYTKALQDQIFHRDLPGLAQALGVVGPFALLKGRQNYLCLYRFERAQASGSDEPAFVAWLGAVRGWRTRTEDGDLSHAPPPSEGYWLRRVTADAEQCLGRKCDHYDDCFIVKARQQAAQARLVVVNHHLLFADLVLRQDGFAQLLPDAGLIVVDEAHQAFDAATQFFSDSCSSNRLRGMLRDVDEALTEVTQVTREWLNRRQEIVAASQRLQLEFAANDRPRTVWSASNPAAATIAELAQMIAELSAYLSNLSLGSVAVDRVVGRLVAMAKLLTTFSRDDGGKNVRWVERTGSQFQLRVAPSEVAEPLTKMRDDLSAAWVLVSATLAVGEDFTLQAARLGFDGARTLAIDSPFDHDNQALVYLPNIAVQPNDWRYPQRMVDAALPLIEATPGGVFLLFTSHRALRAAADYLADRTARQLYLQSANNRHELLQAFRQDGQGVLLGAASFWEGVDVAGSALSLVVIDKLPFAVPDDPLVAARAQVIKDRGGSPFAEDQLPQMLLSLKQGVGRLIRRENDRGVVMLCDPRITSKSYGRLALKSLAHIPQTRDESEAIAFLRQT